MMVLMYRFCVLMLFIILTTCFIVLSFVFVLLLILLLLLNGFMWYPFDVARYLYISSMCLYCLSFFFLWCVLYMKRLFFWSCLMLLTLLLSCLLISLLDCFIWYSFNVARYLNIRSMCLYYLSFFLVCFLYATFCVSLVLITWLFT